MPSAPISTCGFYGIFVTGMRFGCGVWRVMGMVARKFLKTIGIAVLSVAGFSAFTTQAKADDWDDCMSRDVNKITVGCTVVITQNSRGGEDIVKARVARAGAFFRQQLLEKALEDLNEALVLDPRSVNALIGRGDVYQRMNRLDSA